MKRILLIFVIIIFTFLTLTGCFGVEPIYQIWITGVRLSPDPAVVNQPVNIWLNYSEVCKIGTKREYHWQIEGFDEEFVTEKSFLTITFSTPGLKNGYVYTVTEDKSILTNDFYFGILVVDEGVSNIKC
ncbi:hypothetical protein BBF96_05320 [Anoxybacter fermentans]|uniref:Uncharacterized protein n=1 Tax=Anoxybacter fermentans TaxID=1323375 RepID=A0A3S9SX35_9FIRM|nr:hypothetical protein [Anoxybacter fermentans]AZR72859.1 hypothetical protein BBF96_05320 [Anoxybacter fermentans]